MANIHSKRLTFAHSLVTTLGFRLLPAWYPAPAHNTLHSVPRGPLLQEGLAPCLALTTSCASPRASVQLRFYTRWSVLAAWAFRRWSLGPSRRYLSRTFPWILGPLPRLSQRCLYPFLPTELRPSRNGYAVGSLAKLRTTTSVRTVISGLQSFLYVQASKFACHPGRSYLWRFRVQGSHDFYFRAPCTSLPTCTSDMLAVRIGQLTTGDSHPFSVRDLVGRIQPLKRFRDLNLAQFTWLKPSVNETGSIPKEPLVSERFFVQSLGNNARGGLLTRILGSDAADETSLAAHRVLNF